MAKQVVKADNPAEDDYLFNLIESLFPEPATHCPRASHPEENQNDCMPDDYEANVNEQANYSEYMQLIQNDESNSPTSHNRNVEDEFSNDVEISSDEDGDYDEADDADTAVPIGGNVFDDNHRFLPFSSIEKIMRKHVQDGTKISRPIKLCIQECASEFISFVTSEANDLRIEDKRGCITGDDVINAMAALGFDNYVQPLKNYLATYKEWKSSPRGKEASAKMRREI